MIAKGGSYVAKISPTVRGAMWMSIAVIALTTMAALIRVISSELPLATILFLRSSFSLLVVVVWIVATGRMSNFQSRHRGSHFIRALCGVSSFAFLVLAYRRLDFALATALAYTTPLWVIVLSVLVLGERPGFRRAVATGFGFLGVLIVLRPLPLLDLGVWAALASAAFGAIALSYVRWLSSLETTETLLFYFFLFGAILSAAPAAADLVLPNAGQFAVLAGISAASTIGLACAAQAYRLADATIIAPLDFLRLPVAPAIGLIFFSEVPQVWLLAGATVMIASLYYIVSAGRRREQVPKR
jgi:drug/metabolite transporter (DMT)-like permease